MKLNDQETAAETPIAPPPELRQRIREGAALASAMLDKMDNNTRLAFWTKLVKHFGVRANAAVAVGPLVDKILPGMAEEMEMQTRESCTFSALAIVQAAAVLDEIEAAEKAR